MADHLTALATRAGSGDRDAVTAFIRATQHDVIRFLTPLTDPADVEDLAQETYLRAIGALPAFEARSSARTWLLSIARRVSADHIRRLTRRPRHAALPDWQATAEATNVIVHPRFEEQHAIATLLHDLAPDRREAFVATQVLGLSDAEAADICDCPIGTIRSRVARAREDLVAALEIQRDPSRRRVS